MSPAKERATSATAFEGFPPGTLAFLKGLARTNTKAWFDAHRADYEAQAKAPMLAFVGALNGVLEEVAPACVTEPKKALFRMNRDTRFSKDKSPYKTTLGARFGGAGGPPAECAGYYVSVGAEGVEVGVGCHVADGPQLARLRERIATKPAEARRLLEDPALAKALGPLRGERLVRVPKPYDPEHVAGDLLRLKQAYHLGRLPVALVAERRLVREVGERFRLGAPLVAWLADVLA